MEKEKVLFVIKNSLGEVNKLLEEGWKVKGLYPISENVSVSDGSKFGRTKTGEIYAYIVLQSSTVLNKQDAAN